MKPSKLLSAAPALCALAMSGCAHGVPKELADARAAYHDAANGLAQQEAPAQLHTAQRALALAEASFANEGDSPRTRDRAYIALRRAQRAEAEARQVDYEQQLAQVEQKLNAERAAAGEQAAQQQAAEAQARAQSASEELARVGKVKQELRGTVITLSGPLLFAKGKADLLPGAQDKLDEVANVLAHTTPDATIMVEGHTDSTGSEALNLDLSTRRAQAVRDYLSAHGVSPDRIRAEGFGPARPVADNKTAEGRAINRRVEIVVQPQGQGPSEQGAGPHG